MTSLETTTYSTTSVTTSLAITATGTLGIAGVSVPYTAYYYGAGVEENVNNPGNTIAGHLATTTTLAANLPFQTAATSCANFAAGRPGEYYSFQLLKFISSGNFECRAYWDDNSDGSYFNVPNSDVSYVFGFSQ